MPPTFQSLNLRPEIGGNSYAVRFNDELLVLDAGMHPKEEGPAAIPRYAELPYDTADAIIVTHSHLDHIGTLPVLQRDQPSSPVYLTAPTAAIGEALLHNSVNVMKSQRLELGIEEYPLYSHREIERVQTRWMARDYERPFLIDPSGKSETQITFFDAGHIMGSAGAFLEGAGRSLFYTGDVHFADHTLSKGARLPELNRPDALVLETTRGSSPRPAEYTRAAEEKKLADHIRRTLEDGGSVMIPVFAIGKTQEVLTMLHSFKEEGLIPEQTPIIIGGLSTKMTVIYDSLATSTRRTRPGFEILKEMEIPVSRNPRKRKPIELNPGCIYAISSGMMSEKTVSNTLGRGFLPNHKNSLLFVGYADPDSPAGKIRQADTGDIIELDRSHKVQLNCKVEVFDFSGHATRDELAQYARQTNPKKLFLVHGDPDSTEWFQKTLTPQMPNTEIIIPEPKRQYEF